ncbi:DNA topoisomerase I [Rubinisphaera margarita]|uniref:DNA topoisomerase I n=1 Tax=Rubinisphaera margarita TaxID=2909586 RepID=UPI001EE79031|nr:DNA topoisomerase I [Rubinisphaera margarita]MCG6154715.1 DNA topoisomerase I [Rubinisphaera margarita]
MRVENLGIPFAVGSLFRFLYQVKILSPILRPLFRLLLGLIAIPMFRFILRRFFRVQEMDPELEKDLEQWFKGSLVLLAATKNMEMSMFSWLDQLIGSTTGGGPGLDNAWITGLRIMMAIGVIEMMPDQELFAIIHPGPPKFKYDRKIGLWNCLRNQCRPIIKGLICQHLNRSSPVFAILSTIFPGPVGWICFGFASAQYLIIGLVTSRDRALDALAEFDRQVAIRREQIREEFSLDDSTEEELPEDQKPAPATPEVSRKALSASADPSR